MISTQEKISSPQQPFSWVLIFTSKMNLTELVKKEKPREKAKNEIDYSERYDVNDMMNEV